jgi:hypothetical protein
VTQEFHANTLVYSVICLIAIAPQYQAPSAFLEATKRSASFDGRNLELGTGVEFRNSDRDVVYGRLSSREAGESSAKPK